VTTPPLRTSVEIAAPPEVIYQYFTRPEAMVAWMGDVAVLEATPGGLFSVDINGVPVRGRYLELEPPHRLLISWGHAGSSILPPGTSVVEITLSEAMTGTLVTVEHRDLPTEEAPQHAAGWPHFLSRLGLTAIGRDPGPDPFAQTASDRD
jgi:uncharacterized protein YndB with AHSA1/START domain